MEDDEKDKKDKKTGRRLLRLAASEFLFYACYNWYIYHIPQRQVRQSLKMH